MLTSKVEPKSGRGYVVRTCPKCSTEGRVPAAQANKELRCRVCRATLPATQRMGPTTPPKLPGTRAASPRRRFTVRDCLMVVVGVVLTATTTLIWAGIQKVSEEGPVSLLGLKAQTHSVAPQSVAPETTVTAPAAVSASGPVSVVVPPLESEGTGPIGSPPIDTEVAARLERAENEMKTYCGQALVEVVSARIGRIKIGGSPVLGITSSDPVLCITLRITNEDRKRMEYTTWSGEILNLSRNTASVTDSSGRNYRRQYAPTSRYGPRPVGRTRQKVLEPGESITEVLAFDPVIHPTEVLILTLPAQNVGGSYTTSARIYIPADKVENIPL